jgi:hypothetical protein
MASSLFRESKSMPRSGGSRSCAPASSRGQLIENCDRLGTLPAIMQFHVPGLLSDRGMSHPRLVAAEWIPSIVSIESNMPSCPYTC